MAITSYSELQSAIADELNRSDLTSAIQQFIANAEDELRRDQRVVTLKRTTLIVDSEVEDLPSDYKRLDSLYHDGPTYFGPIEVTIGDALGELKGRHGNSTGVPQAAVIVPPSIVFGPEPDDTYTLALHYWATIPRLSDSASTNWLLASHPDIYLYSALLESAPYLKDDERLQVWANMREQRLQSLDRYTENRVLSGTLVRKPNRPIG